MALSLQRYACDSDYEVISQLLKQRNDKEHKRSMKNAMEKAEYLPENLIVEILSWLPVKYVLQYKSVCKSWYAIISNAAFVSKHLKNYYNNNEDWRSCLLANYHETHAELKLYELLVDETPRVLVGAEIYPSTIHIMHNSTICGPCNGIYYLYEQSYNLRALWNPTMNKFKYLPKVMSFKHNLPPNTKYLGLEVNGLGLDPLTGDYKVAVIGIRKTANEANVVMCSLSVFVYSLSTDSWRYCGDLARIDFMDTNRCYMYVNGWYYWLGSYNNLTSFMIVAFNMGTDTFIEMDVPDYAQPSSKVLAIYDDSLAFLSLHDEEKVLDVWTFGNGCWTKKLTLGPLLHIWNPVGHWKDNLIVLENRDCKLVLIDLDSQELKDLDFGVHFKCYGVFAYMESLVSFKDNSFENISQFEELEAFIV
ncbi:unnamed protein product [Amaranthus hypochondriacus]